MSDNINVCHYVDIGMNFPYYILARTNLRIPPFATHDSAYAEIHQKYGKFDTDWNSVTSIGDAWWNWLWGIFFNGPYESAQQTIECIHPEDGETEADAAADELVSVVEHLIPEYTRHWEQIYVEVNSIVQSILESFPTDEILRKNEALLHRTYQREQAFFYYDLLRTTATQSKNNNGSSVYVVGLGYLRDTKGFAGFMSHELRHILINQSGVFDQENILTSIQSIHSLTKDWQDSSQVGCVIENMNFLLDDWYENGIDLDFSEFSRRQSNSGRRKEDIAIAGAFYDNRKVLADNSFERFVEMSVKQLADRYGMM